MRMFTGVNLINQSDIRALHFVCFRQELSVSNLYQKFSIVSTFSCYEMKRRLGDAVLQKSNQFVGGVSNSASLSCNTTSFSSISESRLSWRSLCSSSVIRALQDSLTLITATLKAQISSTEQISLILKPQLSFGVR